METLGGPHAVEQKQTNGPNGLSSVAQRGGGGAAAQEHSGRCRTGGARAACCKRSCQLVYPSALQGDKSPFLAHTAFMITPTLFKGALVELSIPGQR